VIQRDLFPFGPPWLERLLFKVNPHLAYDTDDPVYIRPSFTPDTVFQKLRRFDKVAEVVRHARFVSVSTEPIAKWARQFNPDNVRVVPMVLTMDPYEKAYRDRSTGSRGEVVIGWSGTGGSVQYLESLAPALRRVAEKHPIKVRVVSGAYASVRLPGVPLDAQPWTPEGVLPSVATFDIGLTPLHDEPFEREKFPSKALQYMALRVPVVASRVGTIQEVIQNDENGLLAGDEDEWVDQLSRLASDAAERKRLGEAGYQSVLERFTVQRAAPTMIEGLRQAAR
jgi:glycosyltransferase involved in cell wall biosynthesis